MSKTSRLQKDTADKQQYLKHYKKAGKNFAMSYAQWREHGSEPVYFSGIKKPTVEAQLRESRVTKNKLKMKLKRNKK